MQLKIPLQFSNKIIILPAANCQPDLHNSTFSLSCHRVRVELSSFWGYLSVLVEEFRFQKWKIFVPALSPSILFLNPSPRFTQPPVQTHPCLPLKLVTLWIQSGLLLLRGGEGVGDSHQCRTCLLFMILSWKLCIQDNLYAQFFSRLMFWWASPQVLSWLFLICVIKSFCFFEDTTSSYCKTDSGWLPVLDEPVSIKWHVFSHAFLHHS